MSSSSASTSSVAASPGSGAIARRVPEAPHPRRGPRRWRRCGSPGSRVESPPVSRPPIAFGWPGQRQRAGARAADVPRREAEVDQRAVLQRPHGRLVRAHRPQRHRALGGAEPARGLDDVLRGTPHTSAARDGDQSAATVSASSAPRVWRSRKRVSSRPSRSRTCSIALSSGRSVPGRTGRWSPACSAVGVAARVGDDQERALGPDPVPHDRVAGLRVGAEQEQDLGLLDVRVRRRRPVRPQRAV